MHGKIRVDALAAAAITELLHPTKFRIFQINESMQDFYFSCMLLFEDYFVDKEESVIKSIMLAALIVLKGCADKIVMLLGKGTHAKVKDKMLLG